MKFMLFIYPDRSVELGADEKAAVPAAVGAWVSEMDNAQISGFNILDCADLDEALEVASKPPVAKFGTLELRAFVES
jgi:hypothetical protein